MSAQKLRDKKRLKLVVIAEPSNGSYEAQLVDESPSFKLVSTVKFLWVHFFCSPRRGIKGGKLRVGAWCGESLSNT